MFNGSWKESNEEHINLEIPDENIDVEGMDSFKIIYFSSNI